MCGVTSGSMGARELHYVLRVLGPTACRDEQLFVDSAKALLKIALPVPKRGESCSLHISSGVLCILKLGKKSIPYFTYFPAIAYGKTTSSSLDSTDMDSCSAARIFFFHKLSVCLSNFKTRRSRLLNTKHQIVCVTYSHYLCHVIASVYP